jgi:hypothetical protein
VVFFGGMGVKHSPVRTSMVMEPRMIEDLIDETPQKLSVPNISEHQRSISSPLLKNSPAKRDDSLQTVQYENIKTNLEKNNQ